MARNKKQPEDLAEVGGARIPAVELRHDEEMEIMAISQGTKHISSVKKPPLPEDQKLLQRPPCPCQEFVSMDPLLL